jgi:uncharacterized repeat protein (TIGR03803 family)
MRRIRTVLLFMASIAFGAGPEQSSAQTLTTMLSFDGQNGEHPRGSLTLAGSMLYGMTHLGGPNGKGVIFSIPVTGGAPKVLATFDGGYGKNPTGNLTVCGSTLYGAAGGVFSVSITGDALKPFRASAGGSLTLSGDGSNLYGITKFGGAFGAGTIFSLPITRGTPKILASFKGKRLAPLPQRGRGQPLGHAVDGANPSGSLTLSVDRSTLYGTTSSGGGANGTGEGSIFSISTDGENFKTLFVFDSTNRRFPKRFAHGASPAGILTLGRDGSTLYGMTSSGGGANGDGYGTIFRIATNGTKFELLFSFEGDGRRGAYPNGADPQGGVTLSGDGSTLYGMASFGGATRKGTIFRLSTTGENLQTLVNFNGVNGQTPFGGLTPSGDGSTLFGMTSAGGEHGKGTVFKLTLPPRAQ